MSTDAPAPVRWRAPGWLLAAAIAFGGLLRWTALTTQQAISVDSVRYLTFAQNWTNGQYFTLGPTGLKEFPDLGYPLLVALILPAVGDPVRAGQLVSWFAGVLLLIVLARVARALYGPQVAFYAVLLAAVSTPLLIISGQCLTESLYLLCSLAALDAALLCVRRPSGGAGMLLGFACALGYLTRGIGLLLLPLALALCFWLARRGEGSGPELPLSGNPLQDAIEQQRYQLSLVGGGWRWCIGATVLTWTLMVMPYWAMLHATYGAFTISDQAIWHVGSLSGSLAPTSDDIRLEGTLNAAGTEYALNEWVAAGRPKSGGLAVGALIRRFAENWVGILYYIPEEVLEPLTIVLLTLGLFGGVGKPRIPRAALILLWWLVPVLIFQPLFLTLGRYLLPAVPILLIWAGRGLLTLQEWAVGRLLLAKPQATAEQVAGIESAVFLLALLLYLPAMLWPVTHIAPRYQNLEARAAGEWLARHGATSGGLFASGPVAGYYAQLSPNLVLPDATLSGVLRMADRKGVDYILLEERRLISTRDPELSTLLYCEPSQLPASLIFLHDIRTWRGYWVRIVQIRRSGLADAGAAER